MDAFASHFSEQELTFSQTAVRHNIDNTIPDGLRSNLIRLSWFLETLRELVNTPIIVSSGYRCPELNRKIGGSKTSAHMQGLAADVIAVGMTPYTLARIISDRMYEHGYDQVIHEFGRWVHIGLSDGMMRLENLTAMKENGQTVYKQGILDVG